MHRIIFALLVSLRGFGLVRRARERHAGAH